jgi:hypothetical protein
LTSEAYGDPTCLYVETAEAAFQCALQLARQHQGDAELIHWIAAGMLHGAIEFFFASEEEDTAEERLATFMYLVKQSVESSELDLGDLRARLHWADRAQGRG